MTASAPSGAINAQFVLDKVADQEQLEVNDQS